MDRDGDMDLVVYVWEYDGGAGIDWLHVLLNDGAGGFTTACTPVGSGVLSIAGDRRSRP